MNPQARTQNLIVRETADGLIIWDGPRNQEYELSALAAVVWRLADGQRTVTHLAELVARQLGAAPDEELVWSALDLLADENLLAARVAPPTGIANLSRRNLLRRVGVAAALAVSVALPNTPNADAAPASEQDKKKSAEAENKKDVAQEAQKKAAEEKEQKASEQKKKAHAEEHEKKKAAEQTKKTAAEAEKKKSAEADSKKSAEAEQKNKGSAN